MTITVDDSFIKQYESEVHEAYQQRGAKMRGACRIKQVAAEDTTFQKVGKGTAGKKTRHGKVPVMNAAHTTVTATLEDWFAGDWSDKLDELKQNIDERTVVSNAGAFALGRKVDGLINAAARLSLPSGQKVAEGGAGLTKAKALSAIEILNKTDVMDDGQRFCFVGPHQWNELTNITEFASADYVGESFPFLKGMQEPRRWLNVIWIYSTQLTLGSGTRYVMMWHRSAMGLGEGMDITSDITWHGDYAAHFINNMLSAGSVRIDDEGVVEIACDDDATIS